jgi:O-antigen/teichoic acid export membrane protein
VMLTVLLAIPFGSTMFVMGAWQSVLTAIFAATAIAAFQLHETLRRSLMSHFLYTKLIWGDAVAYLGMAGTIVSLVRLDALSVPAVFATMTLTFLLAAGVQAWWVQPTRATRDEIKPVAKEFWVLGKWILASNLTLLLTNLSVQWCLALFQDLTHVAKLTALVNLIKLTNPMLSAMSGLIVPAVAREGNARAGLRYAVLGLSILAPYFLVLFIAPDFSVGLFYGKGSQYIGYGMELRVAVATCVAGYISAMMLAMLMGLGRSKSNFYAQVVNSIASVGIALPAAIFWGWTGALLGGMIALFVTAIMALILLLKALPHHRPA